MDKAKLVETTKYPEYVQAVEDFLSANPKEGEIVSHEWLDEHLDLQPDQPGYALRKLSRVQGFRKELLTKHNIDLKNVLGQGYYIVPAVDQTMLALKDARDKYAKAGREGLSRCIHVRTEELNPAQIAANQRAIELLTGLNTTISRTITSGTARRAISAPKA